MIFEYAMYGSLHDYLKAHGVLGTAGLISSNSAMLTQVVFPQMRAPLGRSSLLSHMVYAI